MISGAALFLEAWSSLHHQAGRKEWRCALWWGSQTTLESKETLHQDFMLLHPHCFPWRDKVGGRVLSLFGTAFFWGFGSQGGRFSGSQWLCCNLHTESSLLQGGVGAFWLLGTLLRVLWCILLPPGKTLLALPLSQICCCLSGRVVPGLKAEF